MATRIRHMFGSGAEASPVLGVALLQNLGPRVPAFLQSDTAAPPTFEIFQQAGLHDSRSGRGSNAEAPARQKVAKTSIHLPKTIQTAREASKEEIAIPRS